MLCLVSLRQNVNIENIVDMQSISFQKFIIKILIPQNHHKNRAEQIFIIIRSHKFGRIVAFRAEISSNSLFYQLFEEYCISYLQAINMNQQVVSPNLKGSHNRKYVGIQLGGTNYNVAIAVPRFDNSSNIIDFDIIARKSGITYENPSQSLEEINSFIKQNQQAENGSKYEAYRFIGIASFGPLCLNKSSPLYGSITTTPKELWRGMKVLNVVSDAFEGTPSGIDTDVNAAAFAQFKLGKHGAKESLAYITVGTGVGVGVIAGGKTIHGLTHPQGGHIIVQRAKDEFEHFRGVCPFHKEQTCLEGMTTNKSIAERLQVSFTALEEIPDDSKVWGLVAFYLAQLCLNITLLLSPEVIVIGGGIMRRKLLFGLIHKEFIRMLSGYVEHPLLGQEIDKYIVAPSLGNDVGVKGAMALSQLG